LGLPYGAVIVAFEISLILKLPLGIFVVRKLGVPGYEELAMGAVASYAVRVMNESVLRMITISHDKIEAAIRREEKRREEKRREEKREKSNGERRLAGKTGLPLQ
jgi:putative phosphoribosyl transferase